MSWEELRIFKDHKMGGSTKLQTLQFLSLFFTAFLPRLEVGMCVN